jgi:hypothetical protein
MENNVCLKKTQCRISSEESGIYDDFWAKTKSLRQNRDETESRVQMSIGGMVSQGDRAT